MCNLTTKVSGPVADWRGLESHRGVQFEGWGVERQELSGGGVPYFPVHHPIPPRILDRNAPGKSNSRKRLLTRRKEQLTQETVDTQGDCGHAPILQSYPSLARTCRRGRLWRLWTRTYSSTIPLRELDIGPFCPYMLTCPSPAVSW